MILICYNPIDEYQSMYWMVYFFFTYYYLDNILIKYLFVN